ncbi:MAG: hypothetical protein PUF48_05330 [Oscillospiraceae bacterium]|nr:hypothetical protein [Oscillospiraceae bacterium]
MKENIKKAVTLFVSILVAGILSVLTYFSINIMFYAFFTDEIGYDVYGQMAPEDENEVLNFEYLYTYEYSEGEFSKDNDEQYKKYEEEGYLLDIQPVRNTLNKSEKTILYIVTQLFCWFFSFFWVYKQMHELGDKDGNIVVLNLQKENLYKGLIIAALASIPAFLSFIGLIVSYFASFDTYMIIYQILNAAFWPTSHLFMSKITAISDMQFYHFALLFLFQFGIPILGGLSYYFGYKNSFAISRREKGKRRITNGKSI